MKTFIRFIIMSLTFIIIFSSCTRQKDVVEDMINDLGRSVEFGEYYSEDSTNKSPIIWDVFDVTDNKVYLISHYIIDCVQFCDKEVLLTDDVWTNSSLREWLNDDFYNTAFNEDEKSIICTERYSFMNHSRYEGGRKMEITKDSVTLLTPKQAESFLLDELYTLATPYAVEKGVFVAPNIDSGVWWLMSPGYYESPACVDIYGGLRNTSYKNSVGVAAFNDECVGVRPVIVINCDDFVEIYDDIHVEIIN